MMKCLLFGELGMGLFSAFLVWKFALLGGHQHLVHLAIMERRNNFPVGLATLAACQSKLNVLINLINFDIDLRKKNFWAANTTLKE